MESTTTTLPKNCGTSPNYTVCSADVPIVNPAVSTTNNRFSSGQGYSYDSSGNTTGDAEIRTFVYDAENKQVSVSDGSGTIGQYSYDGDGKRIKKYVPSTGETTIFVYDAAGKLIGEYSTIVQTGTNAKTVYTTNDHLGSPRLNTDATGQVISRHDYHPFGEEIVRTGYGSDTIRKQFTGYERDGESFLDFAEARYYRSEHGRFTSVDPENAGAQALVPQSWNGYAYVGNNPILYTDPTGEDYLICDPDGKKCYPKVSNKQFEAAQAAGGHIYKDGKIYSGDTLVGTYKYVLSMTDPPPNDQPPTRIKRIIGGIFLAAAAAAAGSSGGGAGGGAGAGGGIFGGMMGGGGSSGGGNAPNGGLVLPQSATLDVQAIKHIVEDHNWNTTKPRREGLALLPLSPILSMIRTATQQGQPRAGNFGGRIVFEHNFHTPIGLNSSGKLTTRIRVVLESNGRVVTAFPY